MYCGAVSAVCLNATYSNLLGFGDSWRITIDPKGRDAPMVQTDPCKVSKVLTGGNFYNGHKIVVELF